MKILFVLEDYIIDPLGIAYLSSYLKLFGHQIELVNFDAEDLNLKLSAYHPDVVAYSVTTGRHAKFKAVNLAVRDFCFRELGYLPFSLFGGPHCTFYPDFAYSDGIDAICQGEGFQAFQAVLAALEQKDFNAIAKLPNIRTARTQPAGNGMAEILDKNSIPCPDRELMYKYPKNQENPIRSIIASFECGLFCKYCYAPKYRQIYNLGQGFGQIKARDAKQVCAEADEIKRNWKTELFYFQDDVFPCWKKSWIDEFCRFWRAGNFHIQIRAEMINESLIRKLKAVGLHGVTFAVESGVERIRKEILNRRMSNEQIIEAAEILRKNDIRFRIENMMGVLGETFDDALETLKLNIKCKPDLAWSSLWQPYPGTELGDEAIRRGLFNPESDKIGFDFFHDTILIGKESRKIANLQKLFGVTVRFPWLEPLIPALCLLPKNPAYNWIYKQYKQWCYESRLYNVKPHLRGSKQMSE